MLMLHLDQERVLQPTRTRTGEQVTLSQETCEFVLQFCLHCMSAAEARLALQPKRFAFLEEETQP